MFFRKKPAIIGGATPLFGEKFDMPRVLFAYEQLFDALTAKFGDGTSRVRGRAAAIVDGVDWPYPGKEKVIDTWRFWSQTYDVLGEGVHHAVGPIAASAFLLAKNWSVYDTDKNRHALSNGQPIESLDTAPQVTLYKRTKDGEMVGMRQLFAEKIRSVVLSDLVRFGFVYTTVSYSRTPDVIEVVATVTFPHSIYGAGKDWLRVRCVAPDGAEVQSALGGN